MRAAAEAGQVYMRAMAAQQQQPNAHPPFPPPFPQVVLFAVPGAFTPTCSLKHLPGFVEKVGWGGGWGGGDARVCFLGGGVAKVATYALCMVAGGSSCGDGGTAPSR